MKKRVVIVFAVLALGGAAIFVQKHFRKNNKEDVLKVSGNVEVTEVDAGFKLPGRINATLVEEGDKVHKGEKIAALESAELESEVARAEASLSEAEARLKELRAGSRPQERKEAESEVSLAEAELTKAKKDFERADMLFTNGAISASQYDSFRKTLDSSEARLRGVKERLSLVKEGPRKEEIKAALYRVKQ
ncbi:MAG: biotin/lipoyl-binding protein, partial [Deltaproteobacteria bacterium]|nr:biotin/lipoyl-binding protein [Deltaproteobacteria bacterium]